MGLFSTLERSDYFYPFVFFSSCPRVLVFMHFIWANLIITLDLSCSSHDSLSKTLCVSLRFQIIAKCPNTGIITKVILIRRLIK